MAWFGEGNELDLLSDLSDKTYKSILHGVPGLEKVVTELAVLEITPKGFKLLERAPGVSVEHIIASTEAPLLIEGEIPEMTFD